MLLKSRLEEQVVEAKKRIDVKVAEAVALFEQLEREEAEWTKASGWEPRKWTGKIKIDVGGKKFFTTMPVLSAKEGFFRALAEGVGNVQKDSEGCLFLDRSPFVFRYILNHLSDQPVLFDQLTQRERNMLRLESEFYELNELQELVGKKNDPEPAEEFEDSEENLTEVSVYEKCDAEEMNLTKISIFEECETFVRSVEAKRSSFERKKQSYARLLGKIEATVSTEKIKLQLQEDSQLFSTTLATLTSKPGMLQAKFSRKEMWEGDIDPDDNSVFLNKDGSTFDIVLNFLRGYPAPNNLTKMEKKSLESDLDYFALGDTFAIPYVLTEESEILNSLTDRPDETLKTWLSEKTLGDLLFRATRDGIDVVAAFHRKCDKKDATLVLAKTDEGFVFGGYAGSSWTSGSFYSSGSHYLSNRSSFIFTLVNPHNIPPTKFDNTNDRNSLCCDSAHGPVFGKIDLDLIRGESSGFPHSYGPDTTGKRSVLFAGSEKFTVVELEVFEVQV